MNKRQLATLIFFLLFSLSFFPRSAAAYTDYSIHRVETGGFLGEEAAKGALETLKSGTGWWATYEATGKSVPYYQVSSGGFSGEQNVKEILNQFQTTTGFSASYKPLGNPIPYRQVMSGSFYGEENTKRYIQEFNKETGLTATYSPSGEGTFKKRIISGTYIGEENVKQAIQQFQQQTGLTATYQPTGQYQEYLQVVSGGFGGEENVKSILQDFISSTGLNATYEPTKYSDNYRVMTGGFAGEENVKAIVNQLNADLGVAATYIPGNTATTFYVTIEPLYGDSLNSVTSFLDKKGWWYSKNLTGTKTATSFRIVSEPTVDSTMVTKALNFYKNHGWWATTSSTGNKVYSKFMIYSQPIVATEINKGLAFFASKGWWATTETTTEKEYVYFNIISDPYLEKENINKAVDFFNAKHWWNATVQTGKTGYTTYQIVTNPLLGEEKGNQALSFFTNNQWWAMSQPTGAKENYYKIVTGGFQGYDNALANAKLVTDRFGWWTTTVKIKSGPEVMYTNYNLTIEEMFNIQMKLSPPPQTDKYKNEPAYIFSAYVDSVNNQINDNGVNVRKGPGTNFEIVAKLSKPFKDFTILGTEGEWTKVALTWKNAKYEDAIYYLNPNNFPSDSKQYFQFLKLSKPANTNVNEINEKILNGNAGILQGTASSFSQAATLYGINELYLIAHALHETGYGKSTLATGVLYNGRIVYNMYGYGAKDSCAVDCGAKTAFEQGWFTPEAAIIGGAKVIGSKYIFNSAFPQDTLYKMRWHPTGTQQYATDIGWAAKQVTNLYNYYQLLDNYTLYYDLPVYK